MLGKSIEYTLNAHVKPIHYIIYPQSVQTYERELMQHQRPPTIICVMSLTNSTQSATDLIPLCMPYKNTCS
jgi:hypothetical protein